MASSSVNLMGKSASLWYAYHALKEQGKGAIAAGQLKVFTHNLATSLGLSDIDCQQLLSSIGTSTALDDYLSFLSGSLFTKLPFSPPMSPSGDGGTSGHVTRQDLLDKVDEVCWMICSRTYAPVSQTVKGKELYKLWRIFTVLAERSPENENEVAFPVATDAEEVEVFVQQLAAMLKLPYSPPSHCPRADDVMTQPERDQLSFTQFIEIIETRCLIGRQEHVISATVDELYGEIVTNVLKKGYLSRSLKGSVTTGSEQSWYVLTPYCLRYFTRRDELETRGSITLSKSSRVESLPDKAGIGIGHIGLAAKVNRFAIHVTEPVGGSSAKTIELCAPDVQTKFEWIQVIQQAIDWEGQVSSGHGVALNLRRRKRAEKRARQIDKENRRMDELSKMAAYKLQLEAERSAREKAEAQLLDDAEMLRKEQFANERARQYYEAERQARQEVELRLLEEARQREHEQRQLRELEERYRQMEVILEEERRAKKDEEIVRTLQSRILQEEFEKREQLEEMKAELERMLAQEQERSTELSEHFQRHQEMYAAEQTRLENLTAEREKREKQYEAAQSKLLEAERARDKLRVELDRRETDLRLRRGLTHRFNVVLPGPNQSSSSVDGSQSAPVTHRGPGAFTDASLRQACWTSTSRASTDCPVDLMAEAVTSPDDVFSEASASDAFPPSPSSASDAQSPPPVAPKKRSKFDSVRTGCLIDDQFPVVGEAVSADCVNASSCLNGDLDSMPGEVATVDNCHG